MPWSRWQLWLNCHPVFAVSFLCMPANSSDDNILVKFDKLKWNSNFNLNIILQLSLIAVVILIKCGFWYFPRVWCQQNTCLINITCDAGCLKWGKLCIFPKKSKNLKVLLFQPILGGNFVIANLKVCFSFHLVSGLNKSVSFDMYKFDCRMN